MAVPELKKDAAYSPALNYAALLRAVPAPAYACGVDGRITYYNEGAAALWGREPELDDPAERYCGSKSLRTADGVPVLHAESCMARTLREGASHQGEEIVIVRPDGAQRTVLAYTMPLRDEAGDMIGATGVLVDVTERAAAERATRAACAATEASFHAFFDSAVVGAAQADTTGRFIRVNDCYCRITGYTREELLTMRPFDLDHPDDVAEDLQRVLEAIEDPRGVYHTEKRYVRKDGSVGWVDVAATFMRDPTAGTVTSAAIVMDISERKRAEQALQEADRTKDEFLATLAHELRNPLAPLNNAVELLRFSDVRESGWCRDVVERQVRHLSRLIDDLLDVSRITRDKLELRKERLDIAAVLNDAIEASRPALDGGEHELIVMLPPRAMHVDGDVVRLTQVFTNLLTNAAKFTAAPGRVRIVAERDGADAVVRVIDSGIGIEPREIDRIFDKFYQGAQHPGRLSGGLGIGLTLVRRLVELHGGSVAALSEGPGRGSEFVVRVPLAVPAPQASSAGGAGVGAAARIGRRVMIVDDNTDSADSLSQLLMLLGHDTATEYDGGAALERAAVFRPDVVLLDLGMPGMDGYEVCRKLRETPLPKRPLIVAMTGWGRREDRERTKEAGFDDHLVKPVDRAQLEALLARSG